MSNENDAKYAVLVQQLATLNDKFNKFINGDADVTIQTDAGTLKSIAGTTRDLKGFKYVQRVIDHKLYSDMVLFDSDIEIGMLIRVWGDDAGINGIYRKDAIGSFVKVSYSDLYDLRDFLPNPWNYHHDSFTFDSNVEVFSFSLPKSEVATIDKVLDGTIRFSSNEDTNRGSYLVDFKVHVANGVGNVIVIDTNSISVDVGFSTLTKPVVSLSVESDALTYTYNIEVTPFKSVGVDVLGTLDIKLFSV